MAKKKIILFLIGFMVLFLFLFPHTINNARYFIETFYKEPVSYFYKSGIYVYDDILKGFPDMYDVDEKNVIQLNLSKFSNHVEIIFFINIINTPKKITVIMNDKVLCSNKKTSSTSVPHFWEKEYLRKSFSIELKNLKIDSQNEITIICGELIEKFIINTN